jgi:hypothetical protein
MPPYPGVILLPTRRGEASAAGTGEEEKVVEEAGGVVIFEVPVPVVCVGTCKKGLGGVVLP